MKILTFKSLNSTNTYSKENIETLEDKTIVSADFQSAGRGRFTRTWVDLGSENIYISFVLKPTEILEEKHACLTQYLSVCLCKELELLGLSSKIKWPNDVLLNEKKVCGILAETVIKGGKLKGIVLGIGVNLNASVESINEIDRPATSLNLELGQNIDKKDFMEKLINRFFTDYDGFLEKGFGFIKEDYERFSIFNNYFPSTQGLRVAIFNTMKEGTFAGFDDNGNLLLKLSDGHIEHINMGEIV